MKKARQISKIIIITLIPLISLLASLSIGRYNIFEKGIISILNGENTVAVNLLLTTRIPRTVVAFLVGGILAMAGTVLQGIFRNPLVSPDIIGISTGATFGSAIAIVLFNLPLLLIQLSSFIGGIIAVLVVYYISNINQSKNITNIVISGMLVNSLAQAGITFLKYIADPLNKQPSLEYWLMGSFNKVKPYHMWIIIPTAFASLIILYLLRWQVNILSTGDDDAKYLGLNVNRIRFVIILIITFIVSIAVSISGNIGWIGLAAPHIVRFVFGNNNNQTIPASFIFGGSLMLISDTISRSILSSEIPISVITSIIGAPVLGYLLLKVGKEVWE